MRNNQPVSSVEQKMGQNDILVSRTDLKGRIVYANKAFCDLAGFTMEELKGKPHNIVRHPDMPSSAFQDLWDTLAVKKPWIGIVKNRCKNGNYYWVVANASPEYDSQGQVSGYISVRTAPTEQQINAASELYAQVNSGKVKLPSTIKVGWFKRVKLKSVMVLSALVSVATLLALGLMFMQTLQKEKNSIELRVAAVPLIVSVRHVLEFLPQHRGMGNAFLNGNTSLSMKLQSNEQVVDENIKALKELVENSPFATLSDDIAGIAQQWRLLKGNWKHSSAKQSFSQHTKIIDGLLDLSSQLMHLGQLTTDPALDVAHLAEFMSESIVGVNENLGRLRGLGSGLIASKEMSAEQRDAVLELSVMGKIDLSSLVADVEHVIKVYNPALGSDLSPLAQDLSIKNKKFFAMVDENLLTRGVPHGDSKVFFDGGTQVIAASLKLFDKMEKHLTVLLEAECKEATSAYYLALSLVVFGVLMTIFLVTLMMIKTFKPLQELIEAMDRIVKGKYDQNPIKHAHDELGDLVDDLSVVQSVLQYEIFEGKNMAREHVQAQKLAEQEKLKAEAELAAAFEQSVGGLISNLVKEVAEVGREANEMDQASKALLSQSETALEGVDLGSSHVNSTASAIEEMNVTIDDVAQRIIGSQTVSNQAVIEAESATTMMLNLTRVSEEIGSIVGAIADIAEQTNLLALNASIEAARAGDAGRGFSVVAGEVKELANQTSQATAKIREQVEGIQTESESATGAIDKISQTIDKINEINTAVASAMQQQSVVGRDISVSAQQADSSMSDVHASVTGLSSLALEVDKSSNEMIEVAVLMEKRTEDVQAGIDQFLETLRK
ncbi:MAG: methyl-accepting chemotaxis protein [Mariprofundaceae bacterium]